MDSTVAAVVVAASAVIVVLVIMVMSRLRSRRVRRTSLETERSEVTSLERRSWLENQRQQSKSKIAGARLIPALDKQLNAPPEKPRPSTAPASPASGASIPSLLPEEEPAGSSTAKKVKVSAAGALAGSSSAKKVKVPAAGALAGSSSAKKVEISAEEEPAGSGPAKKVEIPAIEDEAEFAEEIVKGEADSGLSAFMIEVSEDDGLSKLADSLEDLDAGNLTEIARDVLSKGAK